MADVYVSTTGSDSTGTGTSGSPYATPGKAASVMSGGDRILIQKGLYTQTSASTNVAGGIPVLPAGTWNAPSQIVGYQSVVGDLDDIDVNDQTNAPTIQSYASGGTTVMQAGGNYCQVRNLVLDGASHVTDGFYTGSLYVSLHNIKAMNCVTAGFVLNANNIGIRLLSLGATFGFDFGATVVNLQSCVASGFSSAGFHSTSGLGDTLIDCIACAGSGSADGFQAVFGYFLDRCVSYGNGRDGFRITSSISALCIRNSIFYGNTSKSINNASGTSITTFDGNYNAYANGSLNGVNGGSKDVLLSSNPFVNPTGAINTVSDAWTNFALSSGGKTALAALGYPAYLDIGAVQHQDAGGGGGGGGAPIIGSAIVRGLGRVV